MRRIHIHWCLAAAITVAVLAAAAPGAAAAPVTAVPMTATAAVAPTFVPATATVPLPVAHPLFTDVTAVYWGQWQFQTWTVDIWWGFDYNPSSNHLAAYALMLANTTSTHLQAEPLNLGDLNGVLTGRTANDQTGLLEIDTDVVGCHLPNGVYVSNLHYSIRWPDGTLTSARQTGQFQAAASVICV